MYVLKKKKKVFANVIFYLFSWSYIIPFYDSLHKALLFTYTFLMACSWQVLLS